VVILPRKFTYSLILILGINLISKPGQTALYSLEFKKNPILKLDPQKDFQLGVGKKGGKGWECDYRKHKPGYALAGLHDPLQLEPGLYRMTFHLKRGNYPKKGLLYKTYGLFRLEIWDLNRNELMNSRELQIADLPEAGKHEERWLEFSMTGREGHAIEPRVYWIGLANGELESIHIEKFRNVSLKFLEDKALQLGHRLETNHLENGFVVSRLPDMTPDELGDALTYTSFYVASLAWRYGATKDPLVAQALENEIQTLHSAIKGTKEEPFLARYVFPDGTPYPKSPSKDPYTAFYLAYAAAYPHIDNRFLKAQMRQDLTLLTSRFLTHGLTIKQGNKVIISLAPYFTEEEIRSGIRKLFEEKDGTKQILSGLKKAKSYLPFTEFWPGIEKTKDALKRKNENELFKQILPTVNGVANLLDRVRVVLREQYRNDLFPRRQRNQDYPGIRLEGLLAQCLGKFPKKVNRVFGEDTRFKRLNDLRVLASNALIVLHMVKTAQVYSKEPQFEEYYRSNLYTQDALLQTALEWFNIEEDLIRLTSGNPAADRHRRGYLSVISLYNLIQLEKNPTVKEKYSELLNRWWDSNKHEDNPLAAALFCASLKEGTKQNPIREGQIESVLKALDSYPRNQTGFGEAYWKENGRKIAETYGGGYRRDYSYEPLPVSQRPKDSFLWQRNPRRLKGDFVKDYPGLDYLFVYWFCRYHKLIAPPPPEPTVQK